MRLTIIIVEYHCMDQVKNCVRSIGEYLDDVETECLVLSNSGYSVDEQVQYSEVLGDAKLITAPGNLGYAGGVNAALAKAHGEYVYVLNPDCLLTDGDVVGIMDDMDKIPEWAIAGPKVVDEDDNLQPSCRRFPKLWTFLLVRSVFARLPGASRERSRYLMSDYGKETPREVDWVSGGATIVKREVLKHLGGMDERYFLYMEDVDWCRAAWQSDYKVIYCPSSKVIHAGHHQSIQSGLQAVRNIHLRWHIISLFKYFLKYRWRTRPRSQFYREAMERAESGS